MSIPEQKNNCPGRYTFFPASEAQHLSSSGFDRYMVVADAQYFRHTGLHIFDIRADTGLLQTYYAVNIGNLPALFQDYLMGPL